MKGGEFVGRHHRARVGAALVIAAALGVACGSNSDPVGEPPDASPPPTLDCTTDKEAVCVRNYNKTSVAWSAKVECAKHAPGQLTVGESQLPAEGYVLQQWQPVDLGEKNPRMECAVLWDAGGNEDIRVVLWFSYDPDHPEFLGPLAYFMPLLHQRTYKLVGHQEPGHGNILNVVFCETDDTECTIPDL